MQDATMDELSLNFLTLGVSDDPSDLEDSPILDQPLSPPQSPPRKRSKATHFDAPIEPTFADFDALPVYARGASKWNHLLSANPTFWDLKCTSWFQTLQKAFNERNVRQFLSNTTISLVHT